MSFNRFWMFGRWYSCSEVIVLAPKPSGWAQPLSEFCGALIHPYLSLETPWLCAITGSFSTASRKQLLLLLQSQAGAVANPGRQKICMIEYIVVHELTSNILTDVKVSSSRELSKGQEPGYKGLCNLDKMKKCLATAGRHQQSKQYIYIYIYMENWPQEELFQPCSWFFIGQDLNQPCVSFERTCWSSAEVVGLCRRRGHMMKRGESGWLYLHLFSMCHQIKSALTVGSTHCH